MYVTAGRARTLVDMFPSGQQADYGCKLLAGVVGM